MRRYNGNDYYGSPRVEEPEEINWTKIYDKGKYMILQSGNDYRLFEEGVEVEPDCELIDKILA